MGRKRKNPDPNRIQYPARFLQEEDGVSVIFPGLGGGEIATCGDTLEEAREMARDALTGYLVAHFERGYQIEEPGSIPEDSDGWEWVSPDPQVEVALLLRRLRKTHGLTQQEAAERVEVGYTLYQRWEHPENCNATIQTLDKVAKAFGRQVEIVFR